MAAPSEVAPTEQLDATLRAAVVSRGVRADERLRDSEERFRLAYEHAPIGMVLADLQGVLTHVNRSFCELLGASEGELLGRSVLELAHPADVEPGRAAVQGLLSGETDSYEAERCYLRLDGGEVWVHVTGTLVRASDGTPLQLIKQFQDITARREAERDRKRLLRSLELQRSRLQEAFDHAPSFLAVLRGPDQVFELVNEAYYQLVGRRDLIGKPLLEALPELHGQGFKELLDGVLRTGEPFVGREIPVRINRAPGGVLEELLVSFVYQPLQDEEGEPVGIMAHGVDVTDGVRAREAVERLNRSLEQQVRERTAELSEAVHELEAFSYSVSHDLRSPLRALDGLGLAVLEDYSDLLDETGKDYLRRIRQASQTMGQLIDDLLMLSRINQGELARMQVDLSACVRRRVEQLAAAEPGRRLELVAPARLLVRGDPRLLQIAVDNLVDNAWKFSARADPARIELGFGERDGCTVCFVRDNGVGFDMRYAGRLFGAFQRLHSVHDFEGTGIGLATVQRVIRRHGGRIWAEATPGQGTTFYFTLGESSDE